MALRSPKYYKHPVAYKGKHISMAYALRLIAKQLLYKQTCAKVHFYEHPKTQVLFYNFYIAAVCHKYLHILACIASRRRVDAQKL